MQPAARTSTSATLNFPATDNLLDIVYVCDREAPVEPIMGLADRSTALVHNVSARETEENFGCDECWPQSAEAAWDARSRLQREAELIDESHFHVTILGCAQCRQRYVSIFAETVDWADGDDPQYWTLVPVTTSEVDALVRSAGALA